MLIQAAKDPPAQGQSSQSEELNRQTVPAEGHRHMVEGEGQTAQPQSLPAGQIPAQQQKAEPPEEELLEQGIHKRDVEGDPEEIFPRTPVPAVRAVVRPEKSKMPRVRKKPPRMTANTPAPSSSAVRRPCRGRANSGRRDTLA